MNLPNVRKLNHLDDFRINERTPYIRAGIPRRPVATSEIDIVDRLYSGIYAIRLHSSIPCRRRSEEQWGGASYLLLICINPGLWGSLSLRRLG